AGKPKRSFGVCTYKPVACLPNLLKFFWHERSEFLNCAAIFTTKKSKGSCTIHQLKKVMYKCALALFFARNINFEKVMCKCALALCFARNIYVEKVMCKCALALFFARNINFEKVMCKCALFLE